MCRSEELVNNSGNDSHINVNNNATTARTTPTKRKDINNNCNETNHDDGNDNASDRDDEDTAQLHTAGAVNAPGKDGSLHGQR